MTPEQERRTGWLRAFGIVAHFSAAGIILGGTIRLVDIIWRWLPAMLGTNWYWLIFLACLASIPLWIIAFSLAMWLIKHANLPTQGTK